MFTSFTLLMAQPNQEGGLGIMNLVFLVAIFFVFYFMFIRPQQKRTKERQKMLESMKKGDKVLTSGGIYGTVAGIDEKTVLVQIADNVKVKLARESIATIVVESDPAKQ